MWTIGYDFYTKEFQGSLIDSSEWPAFERKAAAYINQITYNRIMSDAPLEAKLAACAAADIFYSESKANLSHKVKSYNNDGYSETLYTPEEAAKFYAEKRAREVNLYLPRSHPLRYAGV